MSLMRRMRLRRVAGWNGHAHYRIDDLLFDLAFTDDLRCHCISEKGRSGHFFPIGSIRAEGGAICAVILQHRSAG